MTRQSTTPDTARQEIIDRVLEKYGEPANRRTFWQDISTRHPPYRAKLRSSPGAVVFDLRGSKFLITSIPVCVSSLILGIVAISGRTPWYPVGAGLGAIALIMGVLSVVHVRRRVRITFTDEHCRQESRLMEAARSRMAAQRRADRALRRPAVARQEHRLDRVRGHRLVRR